MGCGASSASAKYAEGKSSEAASATASAPSGKEGAVEATAVQEVRAGETAMSPKAVEVHKKDASPSGTEATGLAPLPGEIRTPQAAQAPMETPTAWWSLHTDWIQKSASEILAAYNFFFEHIGIRKGWRTPPFKKEDVQGPFMASAEVVAVVRKRIDDEGRGMVLRQLEGSSHDFLWGWSPDKPPNQGLGLREFFSGLVFATLSDAKGLVEGLDNATVEYYVNSHPILEGVEMPPAKSEEPVAEAPKAEPKAEPVAEVPAVIALGDGALSSPAAEHPKAEAESAAEVKPAASAEAEVSADALAAPIALADAPAPMMLMDARPG
mmetsp:Transcript_25368/g.45971  ORF Transcript_25368/g.45971 Transcript_25368/m.45971 type:complete len:323 (+) Transcript_25368:121-1089(+)